MVNQLRLICSYHFQPLEKRMFIGFWRSFKVREDVLRFSIGWEVQRLWKLAIHILIPTMSAQIDEQRLEFFCDNFVTVKNFLLT